MGCNSLELLVPILETIAREAASLGFKVNWQVQALGCREDMPLTIKVQGQDVMVVEEFVYLSSLISYYQPEALVTSATEVPSLVLSCRAQKIRFGGHGLPSQRS